MVLSDKLSLLYFAILRFTVSSIIFHAESSLLLVDDNVIPSNYRNICSSNKMSVLCRCH